MAVFSCDIPALSLLGRSAVAAAWYRDSYCAPLSRPQTPVVSLFVAIFGHAPLWMKLALFARNRIAALCGLAVPSTREIFDPAVRANCAVGERIGPWPIFALTDTEIVAGRDNKHLDFRLSVLKLARDDDASVVVSTMCTVHNAFGKVYLFFVVPFHRWGVQWLIANAVRAGRL